MGKLLDALDDVKPRKGRAARSSAMRKSEARKERLENIKRQL